MTPAEWVDLGQWVAMSVAAVFVWWSGTERKSAEKAIQAVNDRLTERIAIVDDWHADIIKRFEAASDHYSKLTSKVQALFLLESTVSRLETNVDLLSVMRIDLTRLQEQVRNKVEQTDREHAEFRREIDTLRRRGA